MKSQIIDTAKSIISDTGIDGISMRNIAAALNVSATALYRHYKNKDAIIIQICKDGLENMMRSLTQSLLKDSPKERLNATLNAYFNFGMENFSEYQLMYGEILTSSTDIQNYTEKYRLPVINFMQDRIKDAAVSNSFKFEAYEQVSFIWAFLHGMILLRQSNQINLSDEVFDQMVKNRIRDWVEMLN